MVVKNDGVQNFFEHFLVPYGKSGLLMPLYTKINKILIKCGYWWANEK